MTDRFVPKATDRSSLRVAPDDLTTYLVEDRRGRVSAYGLGNSKVGPGVFTYSKLPGRVGGSCPGASSHCEQICYAKRVAVTNDQVWALWTRNTLRGAEVPTLPPEAKIVRWHVSGDFDSVEYTRAWCKTVNRSPEVRFFGYTRSWRVPELSMWVTTLRDYPNVQLFASMDLSIDEMPPVGWRRAWIAGDPRATKRCIREPGPEGHDEGVYVAGTFDTEKYDSSAYICPEETGRKQSCVDCGYCILGRRGDVIFLQH